MPSFQADQNIMPHIIDVDTSVAWKTHLRERTHRNLDTMLQDAHTAHKRKVADNLLASADVLYRLELDYKQDVQNLRYIAEEELRAQIEREEQERKWTSQAPWQHPEDADQTVIEEQLAILNQIRNASARMHHVAVQEYNGAFFQQGSSSRPFEEPHSPVKERFGSDGGRPHSHHAQAVEVESTAAREARLRAEKHEKQQEEFRKRAEAIQQRKRQERQWNNQLNWTETMSSSSSTTSASDQEVTTAADIASKAAMSEEDIVNLVIFHDQQWIFISSLPHLQWIDFPWPVLSFSSPKRKEDLTVEAVVEYIFAPLTVHGQDRAIVKDRLKDLIRRWHPDRFETRYLALIADLHERELVRDGAGVVARILNDLLGKWNDL